VAGFKAVKDMPTIKKSQIDWARDKEEVGDAFELEQKAKAGVLEQMAFLSRVDYAVFEQERDDRERQRKLQQFQQGPGPGPSAD